MGAQATPADAVRETIEAYDANAAAYAERYAAVDMGPYLAGFLSMVPPDSRILDAGCGPGRDLARMIRGGFEAVGLDLSRELLAIARVGAPGSSLVHGDLRQLPFQSESFGGVWSVASFLHLAREDFTLGLSEASRVLVSDGVVFVSVAYGKGSEWRSGDGGRRWFQYYDLDDVLEASSSADLEVISLSKDPGVAHGTWINLLAKRRQ